MDMVSIPPIRRIENRKEDQMSQMIRIRITGTNRRKVSRSWMRLRMWGLRKDRYGAYTGTVSRRRVEKLRAYCERVHLRFRIDNEFGRRGGSYRSVFFRTHAPAFGRYYFCAYCGRLLPKRKVTVDHLYPVGSAARDLKMQKKLRRIHLSGINDPENLVAACRGCNQKKGKQMGRWIRKGKLGRHAWYWELRWAFRIVLAAGLLALLIYILMREAGLNPTLVNRLNQILPFGDSLLRTMFTR